MSRDDNERGREWSEERLDALRQALDQNRVPAGFRDLDALVHHGGQQDRDESQVEGMLAQLISAALDGVDIPRRYPRAFRRLLVDPELRTAFLDGLKALEEGPTSTPPWPTSRDLSFLGSLKRQTSQDPAAGSSGAQKMRLVRSAEEIVGLFSFLSYSPTPALREAAGFLENETVTLLRGKLSARGMELDVTLEATRPAAQPDELQLSLWVLAADESAALFGDDHALEATIAWGSYKAEVTITGDGHYSLPPRSIASVVDDSGKSDADLTVTVQPKQ